MFKSAGIMSSLGAEASTGQFELVAAELAMIGAVIAFKKIKEKVHDKRERKQDARDE